MHKVQACYAASRKHCTMLNAKQLIAAQLKAGAGTSLFRSLFCALFWPANGSMLWRELCKQELPNRRRMVTYLTLKPLAAHPVLLKLLRIHDSCLWFEKLCWICIVVFAMKLATAAAGAACAGSSSHDFGSSKVTMSRQRCNTV